MTWGRSLWAVLLGIAGIIGLLMSLCGGTLLFPILLSSNSGLALIPAASLVIGLLVCFAVWRQMRRAGFFRRHESAANDESQ